MKIFPTEIFQGWRVKNSEVTLCITFQEALQLQRSDVESDTNAMSDLPNPFHSE